MQTLIQETDAIFALPTITIASCDDHHRDKGLRWKNKSFLCFLILKTH